MPISQIDRLRNSASQVILFEIVKRNGVLTPVAVRPRVEGGYEIIAGRHGKLAWEAARLDTMPVIITAPDNEQAIIEMVDFGIQREEVLPSEKAAAYKIYNTGTFEGTLDTLTAMREHLTPEETNLWKIGEIIVRYEQNDQIRAVYGEKTLKQLSKTLTQELGKGFSRSNLQNMRQFYLSYPIYQTVSGKLSWSHYCELMSISDADKRSFYEKECEQSGWSVRELKRQIESSLFERLLLSRGDANKEQVMSLAQQGVDYSKPEEIIRDPYVFEFLGVPEDKPLLESDLEKALVQQIEKFLLELGRGFMFVGTQQRVTVGNNHYYVDMVFYNKILRAYVLIELKAKKLTPEAAGQINMYLNYYAAEVNDSDDNPPIGIILCTDKDSLEAEYALGGLSNQIFASRYVLYMPNKEQLIKQVENVLDRWHSESDPKQN